jgi:hypothetical protein
MRAMARASMPLRLRLERSAGARITSGCASLKIEMGSSFRWNDGDAAAGVTVWIPVFAGMTA